MSVTPMSVTPLTLLTPLTFNAVTDVLLTLSFMTHVAVNAVDPTCRGA